MTNDVFSLLTGLGGLALFIYGVLLLSEGLREASGPWFRRIMAQVSRHRLRAYGLGVTMGTAVQSSATTVMAVGFIHAGLLSLSGAVALIAGANLGTSLAMQFIALDVPWLWVVFAVVGLPLRILPGSYRRQRVGQAMAGLALLFLGLRLMGQAVYPFRDVLAPWLSGHGQPEGLALFAALGASLAFTVIVQSSSATMGIVFSLATVGVFTDLSHAIPLIAGAQIGTCITALISSVGSGPEARRGALAHLYFNVFCGAAALILMPWMVEAAAMIGGPPARQVAHLHTLSMLTGGVFFLVFTGSVTRFLRFTAPFRSGQDEQSQLDESQLNDPAAALAAGALELARVTRIVRRGFAYNRRLVAAPDRRLYILVRQTESSVDLIRDNLRGYLMRVAAHAGGSGCEARLQWMNLFLVYLERISDHNENIADLSMDIHKQLSGEEQDVARKACDQLFALIEPILEVMEGVWIQQPAGRVDVARRVRELRKAYLPESERIQGELVEKIANRSVGAVTGFVLTEYLSELDRIVRHTKKIAGLLERDAARQE